MRVLDLFSGIGGFSLGLEAAGMETVAFCEYEEFPQRVLRHHWPDVPIYPDVRELTYEQLRQDGIEEIDLICGGWPCQPFSVAGKRQGVGDELGRHLWPEMLRIIREARPAWVIGENVTGFISLGLEQVCADLENEGYGVQPFVIPAASVNAIHRRERVWVIANASCKRQQGQGRPFITLHSEAKEAREVHRIIDALRWPTKPPVCRANDGLSGGLDKDRLKALGNAVVPQVVQVIGEAIMQEAS